MRRLSHVFLIITLLYVTSTLFTFDFIHREDSNLILRHGLPWEMALLTSPHQDETSIKKEQASAIIASRRRIVHERDDQFPLSAIETFPEAPINGLDCRHYGGPIDDEAAVKDVQYWEDIPKDSQFISPLKHPSTEQFLTFEADEGGLNNKRMAFENAILIALMTGRTLVLPPKQQLDGYAFIKKSISLADFFTLDRIRHEFPQFRIISFENFLLTEALQGKIRVNNTAVFPPNNITNWNGDYTVQSTRDWMLWPWIRQIATPLSWKNAECVGAFPSQRGKDGVKSLKQAFERVMKDGEKDKQHGDYDQFLRLNERYQDKPTPVNASAAERLAEIMAAREKLCIYDEVMQSDPIIHIEGQEKTGVRIICPFYAFLFFEDHHMDLFAKRFIRDHLRFVDQVQCAAARAIKAVRDRAKSVDPGGDDTFYSLHIRRGGDFETVYHVRYHLLYSIRKSLIARNVLTHSFCFILQDVAITSNHVFNDLKKFVADNSTLYIATDNTGPGYFENLTLHYNLVFLKDIAAEMGPLNAAYIGSVEMLIASRGEVSFTSILVSQSISDVTV